MVRALIVIAVICFGCKMITGRWPWSFLRGPDTRGQALFKARKLLAVKERARHGEIIEAHRRLITMVHPDRGGTADQVHEANAARDLLLDQVPNPSTKDDPSP